MYVSNYKYVRRERERERENERYTLAVICILLVDHVLYRYPPKQPRDTKGRNAYNPTKYTSNDETPSSRVEYNVTQKARVNDQIIQAIPVETSDGLHTLHELHADLEVGDTI